MPDMPSARSLAELVVAGLESLGGDGEPQQIKETALELGVSLLHNVRNPPTR
jgi:hypothetical protein